MKRMILLSLASVLGAGLLVGCSNEVHTSRQTCWCPTDAIAMWGQDIYYGRNIGCWSDGHAVPITFPEHCVYYDTTTYSTSTSTTVSASASMGH
jgi:hypothetical protein